MIFNIIADKINEAPKSEIGSQFHYTQDDIHNKEARKKLLVRLFNWIYSNNKYKIGSL